MFDLSRLEARHAALAAELVRRGLEHPTADLLDLAPALAEGQSLESELLGFRVRVARSHARDKCMACDQPPEVDVLWAEGKGRAWFCRACYAEWENRDDVNVEHEVKAGVVPTHWGGQVRPVRRERSAASDLLGFDRLRQIVYGVVLEPEVEDADGRYATVGDVEQAAHGWLPGARQVWVRHQGQVTRANVVESYLAPADLEFDDPAMGRQWVSRGSWILGVKVEDPEVWGQIERGELVGFSPRLVASLEGGQERTPALRQPALRFAPTKPVGLTFGPL